MKYRIVKMDGDKTLYKIQSKFLFFGWRDVLITIYTLEHDWNEIFGSFEGYGGKDKEYSFKNFDNAKEYLDYIQIQRSYRGYEIYPCLAEEHNWLRDFKKVSYYFIDDDGDKSMPYSIDDLKKEIDKYIDKKKQDSLKKKVKQVMYEC